MLDHSLIAALSKAAPIFPLVLMCDVVGRFWEWVMESHVVEIVCGLKKPGNLCSWTVLSAFNSYHFLLPLLLSCLELSKSQLNSIRNRFETGRKIGSGAVTE